MGQNGCILRFNFFAQLLEPVLFIRGMILQDIGVWNCPTAEVIQSHICIERMVVSVVIKTIQYMRSRLRFDGFDYAFVLRRERLR